MISPIAATDPIKRGKELLESLRVLWTRCTPKQRRNLMFAIGRHQQRILCEYQEAKLNKSIEMYWPMPLEDYAIPNLFRGTPIIYTDDDDRIAVYERRKYAWVEVRE